MSELGLLLHRFRRKGAAGFYNNVLFFNSLVKGNMFGLFGRWFL
jgi:hypothetical protein